MRDIKKIIIHCAATKLSMDIGVKEIDRWHREKGYFSCGYHFVIRRNGALETGRAEDKAGAHAQGHNTDSIGICMVGGISENNRPECNFTPEQWTRLNSLVNGLEKKYSGVRVIGHSEVANKACPCFDVQQWLKNGRGTAKENKI